MKTKKIVLFIVEGITDKISLALILSKLITSENIKFHIVGCDITSSKGTSTANAIEKVYDQIKRFMGKDKIYKKRDILKVIHLVDTDGAYVNKKFIKESQVDSFIYTRDCIQAKKVEDVIKRNDQKSKILNKLSTCGNIAKIDYSVYYFSCNLEHVLHNECNMGDERKKEVAEEFEELYYKREYEFIEFIRDKSFAVEGDYIKTWEFIKKGNNSLNRYCNLHLIF
ncbi:MAG: hypothetical protein PHI90_06820 [Clostridia bacterium]|nr:hypothetical protein [Clostridia bacterium]MDD4048523.1 hypothetical protein [Clostridia bacterium]